VVSEAEDAEPDGEAEVEEPVVIDQEPAVVEPEEEDEPEPVEVASLDTLDSYRQTMTTRVVTDDEETEWTMVTEFVRDPAAYRAVWTSVEGDDDAEEAWEILQIEDTTYMRSDDGSGEGEWMAYSSADAEDIQSSADITNWMSAENYLDDEGCKSKGREKVDGQDTIHYVCDERMFTAYSGIWGVTGKLIEASLETWVSDEYGVPLRSISSWVGEDEDGVRHEYYSEGEITDINKPITIEAPSGVDVPGLPEDVPMYPGATIDVAMAGMVSFKVDAAADEVISFYQEAMPAEGWSLDSEMEGMLMFSKEGRSATIMTSEEDDLISVTVLVQ